MSRESVLNSRHGAKIPAAPRRNRNREPCHQCVDVQDRGRQLGAGGRVETLLHALAVGVVRDGDGLKGIIIESKSGEGNSRQAHHRRYRRCRHCRALRRSLPQDSEGGPTIGHGDVLLLRRRQGPSLYVKANPKKYKDWGKNWEMETGGKEDEPFSPYLEDRRQGPGKRHHSGRPEKHRRHLERD